MPSQQRVNWARFRVLSVATVAMLILLTLFYLLTGGTVFSQKAPVYLYMPDGEGVESQAPVRVDGVDVGLVKTVTLMSGSDPTRSVRVLMEIERTRLPQIPANSEAEISSDSLIGDKFVDVTSLPSPASLQPGGEIKLKKSTDLMKAIDIVDLERQLRLLDSVLQDIEAGRGDFGEFVRGRKVYDDAVRRFTEIEAAVRAGVAATTEVGRALYKDELYRGFVQTLMRLDETLARLQSGQGADGHFLHDPAQYEAWRNQIVEMRKSVADLRKQPMMQSTGNYDSWNRSLSAMMRRVDEINTQPILNSPEVYESLMGQALEIQKTVRDFREHPQKYLRLKIF